MNEKNRYLEFLRGLEYKTQFRDDRMLLEDENG